MSNPTDLIDRELVPGNYVVFHNNIYQVRGTGKAHPTTGKGQVKIMLLNPSKSTRPVTKYSGDLCKLDSAEVTFWALKKGYQN